MSAPPTHDHARLRAIERTERASRQQETDRDRLRGILQAKRIELAEAAARRRAELRVKGRRVRAAHRRGLVRACAHEWQLERCIKFLPHHTLLAQFVRDSQAADGGDRLGRPPTNNHLLVFGLVVAAELIGFRGVFARQSFIGAMLGFSGRTVARAEKRLSAYGLLHSVSNYDPDKPAHRSQQAHSYVVSPLGQLLLRTIREQRTRAGGRGARPHVTRTTRRPQPKTLLLEKSSLKTRPRVEVEKEHARQARVDVDGGSVESTSPVHRVSASEGACWARELSASLDAEDEPSPQRRSESAPAPVTVAEQIERVEAAIRIREGEQQRLTNEPTGETEN